MSAELSGAQLAALVTCQYNARKGATLVRFDKATVSSLVRRALVTEVTSHEIPRYYLTPSGHAELKTRGRKAGTR